MTRLPTLRPSSYLSLPEHMVEVRNPTPLRGARVVAVSATSAEYIGMTPDDVAAPAFLDFINGHTVQPELKSVALAYGGYSFGYYHPSLGDGRNLIRAEVLTRDGEWWDLAVKGGGATKYSR